MIQMTEFLRNVRKSYTFRLRKETQTFIEGVSGVLDISEKIEGKYNTDNTEESADFNALYSDWSAVGEDMYSAIDTYDKQRS